MGAPRASASHVDRSMGTPEASIKRFSRQRRWAHAVSHAVHVDCTTFPTSGRRWGRILRSALQWYGACQNCQKKRPGPRLHRRLSRYLIAQRSASRQRKVKRRRLHTSRSAELLTNSFARQTPVQETSHTCNTSSGLAKTEDCDGPPRKRPRQTTLQVCQGTNTLASVESRMAMLSSWPQRPKAAMQWLGLSESRKVHHYKAQYASDRDGRHMLPRRLWKYYAQRYTLFSRFDHGVLIDKEMWYSVTPEPIARAQASHLAWSASPEACSAETEETRAGRIIIDGFCGAGGNAIQLAKIPRRGRSANFVLGIDVQQSRLSATMQNASVYGVRGCVDVICADFRSTPRLLRPGTVTGVFLSPPWVDDGIVPRTPSASAAASPFSVRHLACKLDGAGILCIALALAPSVAMFLPRATTKREIRALAVVARSSVAVHEHVRMTHGSPARHATALTCFFGAWAQRRVS